MILIHLPWLSILLQARNLLENEENGKKFRLACPHSTCRIDLVHVLKEHGVSWSGALLSSYYSKIDVLLTRMDKPFTPDLYLRDKSGLLAPLFVNC